MGLLDGDLAQSIYDAFAGKLLTGQLRKANAPTSGGLDELGDPATTDPQLYDCEGFVEDYDDAYRARAGIPVTDVKVNIFARSLEAGAIQPGKDDKVEMPKDSATWYQLRRVQRDPATALWTCQAYKCGVPA